MDQYVTGNMIKDLRIKNNMTQLDLAKKLNVSEKTISKWETGRGYPDITLLEPLSKALKVTIIELLSGSKIINTNRCQNVLKTKFFVCPICGNIICASGNGLICCCGINLAECEAEDIDINHDINIEIVEDEYYISSSHEMTKDHYISFMATLGSNEMQFIKLYPESNCEARFKMRSARMLVFYCNHHGLFKKILK